MNKSKIHAIERQANNLVKNVCANAFSKSDIMRLHNVGSQAARFFTTIKDHKDKVENKYPLRPIASCRNNPTEKLDWLLSKILNQALKYIPSYIKNTDDLISKLSSIDQCDTGKVFVSLDIKNLYSNIPIQEGIEYISQFIENHWDQLDTYGLTLDAVKKILSFVSFNYEIEYNGKHHIQKKGCPMVTHYSPPFALIFISFTEQKAPNPWRESFDLNPRIYICQVH